MERMLADHAKLLYPTCQNDQKKLVTTLELLQWKAENGTSDNGFENLLKIVKKMLPKDNELPSSTYEAKKVVCPLGFWLFVHGARLDPETGDIVGKGKWKVLVDKIKKKLEAAINDVRNGVFKPDKEDDELTRAILNMLDELEAVLAVLRLRLRGQNPLTLIEAVAEVRRRRPTGY